MTETPSLLVAPSSLYLQVNQYSLLQEETLGPGYEANKTNFKAPSQLTLRQIAAALDPDQPVPQSGPAAVLPMTRPDAHCRVLLQSDLTPGPKIPAGWFTLLLKA